ncbi:HTH-type transcriptional repressor YtrA [Jeotgalicoccus aerolatus]|uniref:GntR family transcriptional regulator n=1 Tax=Jeotgalicoccus aerolatus TaxID=709510 RepID=A0ABS4HJI6_9STAP|nr:GntR family transcriptional regulator [Jeotgalicoccus aerolatus]MBP1951023.1 GntR family transcriptional regulator [Jeotgalicoccus aerolatus]GGE00815.1 GntR family transcriptional regulator [Jeotgalicoccus aerolatus]CAD2078481.1 HTH-type transcriptional repressor YtrA [Jeotgalicoccus aerolatus]HJG32435.1 GntR family transcriptional regulator [Jeotgalicoccus aerolatus]
MFDIDVKSRVPIYEQLTENVKRLIIQGVLTPGEQLPSVRSLAQELTINPNTIQKAYRELEREGYVISRPGKGSFVNDMTDVMNKERISSLTEELERLIKELVFLEVPGDDLKKLIDKVQQEKEGKK